MKIYFCDKCNESIPLKDIGSNRITIDAGKIYCQACAPRSARRPSPPGGYATLAITLLLGLGVGMIGMALWGDNLFRTGESESLGTQVGNLRKNFDQMRARMDGRVQRIEGDLEESPGVGGRSGKLARVLQRQADNADAIQKMRHALNGLSDTLRSEIDNQSRKLERREADLYKKIDEAMQELTTDRLVRDVDALREALTVLEDRVSTNDSRIGTLEQQPAVASSGDEVLEPTAEVDAERLPPEMEKKLQRALEQLASKDAPKRFAAVVDLLEFKVKRAEQAMVSVLDDEAEYVQTAALNNLMEMNARWTIPHVIRKLKDPNVFVREAAIAALERLTGRSIALDPNAPTSKVLAKVRELDKWWEENRAKLLGE